MITSVEYKEQCKDAYANFKTTYNIKERVPDAIWHFPLERPEPPAHNRIANYGLERSKRKFPLISKREIAKYEALGKSSNQADIDEYMAFASRETDRRLNGFFFYNGDILEWITGWHYVYLQYWWISGINPETKRMGKVRPSFRDAQRDVFYMIRHIISDKKSLGVAWLSYRRFGKSSIALFAGFMDTTENEKSRFPIQHKTEEEGKKSFKKFVIDGWKSLPIWFKPIDTGQTSYTKHIVFGNKMQKGTSINDRNEGEVLDSEIFVMPSKEGAVDGDYATWFVRDEAGKCPANIDIEESWYVTREAMFIGARKVGNAILTSTAEDMDKYGSGQFLEIIKKSDPKKRLPNGFTESYLYPLFIPTYYGFLDDEDEENKALIDPDKIFIDEFGYSNIDACKRYHQSIYDALEGHALLSRKRKYPIQFNDAWVISDMRNTFPLKNLIEQKIYAEGNKNWVRGDFEWANGIKDTYVIWRPSEEGKWLMIASWMPNENDRNKFKTRGMFKFPERDGTYIGVDPFSHSATVEHGSMGAAVTAVGYDPYNPNMKESVVCMYHYREKEPYIFAEDILMQAVFFSAKILPERNTHGFIDHIKSRGYEGFLLKDPLEKDMKKLIGADYGFPNTDPDKREALMTITGSWMKDRLGKQEDGMYGILPFLKLIEECMSFESDKWTKYDLVVALMLAVTAMRATRVISSQPGNIADWIPGVTTDAKRKVQLYKQALAQN